MNLIIGSHVSFNKETQLLGSIEEALSYKANTFMFYTGAPQNTNRCDINEDLLNEAKEKLRDNNIDINNIIVHAPYIINLANDKNFDFNVNFLTQEIKRVELLGVNKLVLHPGSHVGLGVEKGLQNIIDALNKVLTVDMNITVCLETMAGKGTELGRTFEEIKTIIDGIKYQDKIGVCLDTCHINDAGYDLNNFDKVLDDFNKIIGLDKLKVLHINDSKNILGSHKDRHENIGYGTIGFDNLMNVIYHDKLKGLPKILETPYIEKKAPYYFEIDMIRKREWNNHLVDDVINYKND
ncbi:MAG: deoxyribonuclease IV [Bacilli bacterium]|nr:deoxyribonuclease IV [Bacilli bacterium]